MADVIRKRFGRDDFFTLYDEGGSNGTPHYTKKKYRKKYEKYKRVSHARRNGNGRRKK